jgi:cystathionine beta-lyase
VRRSTPTKVQEIPVSLPSLEPARSDKRTCRNTARQRTWREETTIKNRETFLEQDQFIGHDRRQFFARAGVFALAPLAANIAANMPAAAAPAPGKFDFDTPLNRLGTDSVHWDMPVRDEHMSKIVAGLGVADMDFRCAPAITTALQKRVAFPNWGYNIIDGDLFMGNAGNSDFIKGIVAWNRKHYGITNIDPKMVGVSPGVIPGIVSALQAFAPKGSKVLMVTPSYVGFYAAIGFTKTVPEESPMKMVNGRYEIDWADFERRMTPDVKVSILCNPHNPAGRAWTREELTRYGQLCKKHNIIVLADEIHCDFISKGHKYVPFASLDKDIVDNSMTFKSGSKSFSLAAMKCAWFFTTNPKLYAATSAANFPSISNPAMVAEIAAYSGGEEWLSQCVDYIDGNLDYAHDYITKNIPMLKTGNKPEGTYLMWLDVNAVADKIGAQKMVDAANAKRPLPTNPFTGEPVMATKGDMVSHWLAKNAYVFMESGSGFGKVGANYVRMNVATPRVTLKAGLDSVAATLKNLA